LFTSLYWRLKRTPLAAFYRRTLAADRRASIYQTLFPPAHNPPIGKEIEQLLRQRYQEEILALSGILGRDLSAWLIRPDQTETNDFT
jgi:hypothetical protein